MSGHGVIGALYGWPGGSGWPLFLAGTRHQFCLVGIFVDCSGVQRDLHRGLSDALRVIEAEGFGASSILVALSFFYGVFHAVGPGHGKIVISTYLLSHESQLRRGVICLLQQRWFRG